MTQSKSIVIAFCLLLATLIVQSREGDKRQPTREELLEQANPGREHEQLATLVGAWTVEVKMGSKVAYKGKADCRMMVGKRFLRIDYETKGRGAIEGAFHIGFDRRHGHYTLIAMDSYGTYFVTSRGKQDEKTHKIKMYGKDDDPTMKAMGFTKEFVHVLDVRGKDEFAVEVWFIDTRTEARKELKSMEYIFKRAT